MQTVIAIKTWRCPSCDYAQDFNPLDAELMWRHFPEVPVGDCPACALGRNPTHLRDNVKMAQETRLEKLIVMTVMGEEDIELEIEREDTRRIERGLLVQSASEKATYRDKRMTDISLAIIEAQKRKYVP